MLVPVRGAGVGGCGTSWGTWARDGKGERESWQLDDVGRYITYSAEILRMLVPVRGAGVGGCGTSWSTWARDGKGECESWQLDDVGRYITCSAEILSKNVTLILYM